MIAHAWLGLELRRRSRALLVLAGIVALTCGTVVAAVAGARRGDSAVDRLLGRTLPATVVARADSGATRTFDFGRLRGLPEVAGVSSFPIYGGFAVKEAPRDPIAAYLPMDDAMMRDLERPVLLAGRLADPARADEAVVTSGFVDRYHLGVGDTATVLLFSHQQVQTGDSAVRQDPWLVPAGRQVRVRVVGVVRSLWLSDPIGDAGRLIPSAALYRQNVDAFIAPGDDNFQPWALVRLVHGEADIPRLRADLARMTGRADVDLRPTSTTADHLRDTIRVQSLWLLAFAAAAGLAGAVVIGQAVARHRAAAAAELALLRPCGLTRGQEVVCVVLAPAVAAVTGTAAGLAGAVLASRWLPFGAAAALEPEPGTDVDPWVFALAALLLPLAVVAFAAALARLAPRAAPDRAAQPSLVAGWARRAGLPVPVVLGARFALEPSAGAAAVRPTLAASTAGALGVTVALIFSAAVTDAASEPARYGQPQQVETGFGFNGQNLLGLPPARVAELARRDPRVAGTLHAPLSQAEVSGRQVVTFGYNPGPGWPGMVLTRGQPPSSAAEVVLAPATARQLHAAVGDTVAFTGQGSQAADRPVRRLRVVGLGFVPQGVTNEYDSGAWVSMDGYRQLFGSFFLLDYFSLALTPGTDPMAVIPGFRDTLRADGAQIFFVTRTTVPERMQSVRAIRVLPWALGLFVALLAVAAQLHTLTATSQRRRRDLAVLRALGLTRRQSRLLVRSHALVLAAVGLVVGVPVGLALGRTLWRLVADSTPMAYRPPASWAVAGAVSTAAVLVTLLLAVPASRRVTRPRIAQVLRDE